ncbi:MAG TPA: sugar ABC transporter permease [Planctomycetota bacterium]|nr:sugar ABC transporter permease [Planctomycetota bacterium]
MTPSAASDARALTPPRGLRDLHIRNLFIIPTLALLILFNVFPLLWSLVLSFSEYRATGSTAPQAVGLANFRELLSRPDIHGYFIFTARFTVLAVAIEAALGFSLALLLNRTLPGKGLIVTLLLLPMMMSPAIMAKFWAYILDPNFGVLAWGFRALGLKPILWFSDQTSALWALVLVDVWQWTPFVMLISLAGLGAIPKHLYEAAQIDRASRWFVFTRITVPLVAPLVMMALIFRTMDAFKIFDLIVLTEGGPFDQTVSVSWHLKRLALTQSETGIGSALGYMVLVLVIGLANLYLKYLDRIQGKTA